MIWEYQLVEADSMIQLLVILSFEWELAAEQGE